MREVRSEALWIVLTIASIDRVFFVIPRLLYLWAELDRTDKHATLMVDR